MTNLCMYELEDAVWDEFCQSDDHIVPHPGYEQFSTHYTHSDSCKKPRSELIVASGDIGDISAASYAHQEQRQGGSPHLTKRRNTMLEKELWSEARIGFPSSACDSMKEGLTLASDNTSSSPHGFKSNNTDSNGSEFCAEDTIIGEKNEEANNSSFSYPLGEISHAENSLDFFENAEDKDSSNFLYYGWPEIGNFEDVDRMFRSCDSTFGLGASKDDDLGWFSSADEAEGSRDVLNSEFKHPGSNAVDNISENHYNNFSVSESAMTSKRIKCKDSSWVTDNSDSSVFLGNKSGITDSNDGFQAVEQADEHKEQVKLQNQFMGRKGNYFDNGCFNYVSNTPNEVMLIPSEASYQPTQSVNLQQLAPDPIPDYAYLQKPMSCENSDNSHLSDPSIINPLLSAINSEANGIMSLSSKDSSHVSSQLQSTERCRDPLFPDATIPKKEKLQNHRGSQLSNVNLQSSCNPGLTGKQVQFYEDKFDNGEVEGGGQIISSELGSANGQESTTTSSRLDDISLEAASFRQLQLVMEKLDLRTKLCIRDSLYRLARSAEQRHNHINMGGFGDDRDSSGAFMSEGSNKGTSFMDIETDTNPIDRSIAHLLFHRPSESPSGVHGSATNHVKVENSITHEETTPDIENMVSGH